MARSAPILERRFFPEGHLIIKEGEDGDHAYIIQSGSVKITKDKGGKQVELAKLSVGDIFGETALLFDEPRTATVKAIEDCNLIIITRSVMEDKLKDSDPTIRAIVKMMKERIKAANTDRVEKTATDIKDVHKLFSDAFKLVTSFMDVSDRKNFQNEASPIMRQFLDLTQTYLERSGKSR
ncbi:MAG: cyclic nucleotide-binding domain-containing protein [Alphaproteobacteria bacterium]|nr:cyclic nucleotide-binding domain-containing protein [Alphaproteobacteria bacterium]